MASQKGNLGVTGFHDQNLKVPYVKDAHGGTALGPSAGRSEVIHAGRALVGTGWLVFCDFFSVTVHCFLAICIVCLPLPSKGHDDPTQAGCRYVCAQLLGGAARATGILSDHFLYDYKNKI